MRNMHDIITFLAAQRDATGLPKYDITCVVWRDYHDLSESDNLHLFRVHKD